MGLINRFLLFWYTLAVAFLAVGAAVLFFQIIPYSLLENELRFVLSRWELLAGAVCLFLLSIHFLSCSVGQVNHNSSSKEVSLIAGNNGEIRVSAEAIKTMLENTILAVGGVSSARVGLQIDAQKPVDAGMELEIHLSLYQGKNVNVISGLVREKVLQAMINSLNIENVLLNIFIDDMSGALPARKQRVV